MQSGAYVSTASSPRAAGLVYTLAALRNFDGVAVPGTVNDGATVVLGAADAVTNQEPITYKDLPGNYSAPNITAFYEWKDGGAVWLTNRVVSRYPAVPSAAIEPGDFYTFTVGAYSQSKVGEGMVVTASSPSGRPTDVCISSALDLCWPISGLRCPVLM